LHTLKKTKLIPAITITSSIVNVGLNFVLIPIYGILGAAISTLIGYFMLGLLSSFVTEKYLSSGLEYKWLVIISIITLITSVSIVNLQAYSITLFLLSILVITGISHIIYSRFS